MDLKVKLVDKAAMDRSGAVAQGLSAINTYIGSEQDPADYARMVSNDLMGITRDDLAYDLGRHVDDSVHRFEEWGLPIWKQPSDEGKALVDGGKPVRSGKWQFMNIQFREESRYSGFYYRMNDNFADEPTGSASSIRSIPIARQFSVLRAANLNLRISIIFLETRTCPA